jgi:DNA polymerase III alpha subunit
MKKNQSNIENIEQKACDGLKRYWEQIKYVNPNASLSEYELRLRKELDIINDFVLNNYFCNVAEVVSWARKHKIPVGPGRGASAGSLVAYSLGITEIDPIHNGLIFERFVFMTNNHAPEFDIDVCGTRLGEIKQYINQNFGVNSFKLHGLKILGEIQKAIECINQLGESALNIKEIPLDDKRTFDLLQTAETDSIFYLKKAGIRDLLKHAKPDRFEDIVALIALYRPGPLEFGLFDKYIRNKHQFYEGTYIVPILESILKETFGVLLYQEQVMQVAHLIAGFSLSQANDLRRVLGVKHPSKLRVQEALFLQGAQSNGYSETQALEVFQWLETYTGYTFSKAHAVSYGLISYRSAYLKANYPKEFRGSIIC